MKIHTRRGRAVRLLAAAAAVALAAPTALLAQNDGRTNRIDPDDAVTRVGTRGANFLEIGIGARANALGGAGTVIARGVESLYWNPAGAALSEGFSVGASYSELFENSDIGHLYVGGMLPLLGGMVGISVNRLTSGDIPRTREVVPSGESAIAGSTFDWTSNAVGGHYARMVTDRLAVGGALKFVQEGIDEATQQWVAFDLGVRFETGLYGTVVGATVANVGGSARAEGPALSSIVDDNSQFLETGRDISGSLDATELDLPTYFRFGIMLDLSGSATSLFGGNPRHRVSALGDFRDAVDTAIQPTVAFEYGFDERLFVRAGKQWFNEQLTDRDFGDGLSVGGGLRLPLGGRQVTLDYAYTSRWLLGNVQTFSFGLGN